ncbi:MAG: FAD-dependent oxidoreductase [Chloroflexi bacterium]|nr:FAD-dependent oxidoreductase [Chloroflexota bacterium]
MKIVVVGGGVAGFSAAMVARKAGADKVVLIERTDMLGGIGMVAGIGLVGSGAFRALAEEKALGGGSLYYDVLFPIATHQDITTPGFDRAMLYNVTRLDARLQRVLKENGIEVLLSRTVTDIKASGNSIGAAVLQDGTAIDGDVFIDASGTATGIKGCNEFGYGCVACILRCPVFGNPKGLIDHKVKTFPELNAYGKPGVIGTSLLIPIASLDEKYQEELKQKGHVFLPVPPGVEPNMDRAMKAASYSIPVMSQDVLAHNVLLLDVGGYVKVTAQGSPRYGPLLRRFPGLEYASIAQPSGGLKGHLVFGLTIAHRKNSMEVEGVDNAFCAGAKAGNALFLLDVAATADLAGYNAVMKAKGKSCLELPKTLINGAFIDYIGRLMTTEEGLKKSPQTDNNTMKHLGVYRETEKEITKEVKRVGLEGIFGRRIT